MLSHGQGALRERPTSALHGYNTMQGPRCQGKRFDTFPAHSLVCRVQAVTKSTGLDGHPPESALEQDGGGAGLTIFGLSNAYGRNAYGPGPRGKGLRFPGS